MCLAVGQKRLEPISNGRLKVIEKVFKIIKEKNIEVDMEETDSEGSPLHTDVLYDRTLRKESVDNKLYKQILKNCHKCLKNSALKSRKL